LDDAGVVQDAVEHRRGQHRLAGERLVPAAEGEVQVRIIEPFS
jgi:hypothetical protein